ncbi:MAG: Ig-like domain-containing protein [Ignavibacteria bacterium]|nr:Ig-like domain-containing protein [Ignavibacteria bacterium]
MQTTKFTYFLHFSFFLLCISMLVIGCANQQPPGGGKEDKEPPKVSIISPKPNSTNFKGNSVYFEFNEYVDRRSFQDAFRISPQIKGDIEFNWGGKDVEVIIPASFSKIDPNKTFVVNINSSFKDIHGNAITEPVNFAFSTGSKIDMGEISGNVFNSNKKIASIFAYSLNTGSYDPTKNIAEYITETNSEGAYKLTNMSPGNYRVIAVIDEDRNLLFTSERESYGVLPYDPDIKDSTLTQNLNFFIKEVVTAQTVQAELDHTKYFKDSAGVVFTSIEYDSKTVMPDQSIFIFFSRSKPTRDEFVNSLKVTGENGEVERMVFNWKNDSLVEVFSSDKYNSNRKYNLTFSMKIPGDSVYNFSLPFRTVSTNSFGDLKGTIRSSYTESGFTGAQVIINLEATSLLPVIKYNFSSNDTVFSFKNILEADYTLFSFIDANNNSAYDYGYPFPFEYSEPFFIYPTTLNIKGGWTVENVGVVFSR